MKECGVQDWKKRTYVKTVNIGAWKNSSAVTKFASDGAAKFLVVTQV